MNRWEKSRIRIPFGHGPVRSLCWHGDELVDFAGGGTRFRMDGSVVPATINWAFRFDNGVASRDGMFRVIYEKLGTKGLVLRGNKCLREINRSFYWAHAYEYPIAILDLPDGVVGLAHCPDEYNRLEIEEIESGNRLTTRPGKSPDFFHSRLQVSPDGTYLLSAGWIWHPLDHILLFSVDAALKNPEHLDKAIQMNLPGELFEISAAAFHRKDSLLLVSKDEDDDSATAYIAEYRFKDGIVARKCVMESMPGTIMPVGPDHFIGFYEHPKLFDISSGKVIESWPNLNSGKQNSSIIPHDELLPPLALDSARKRFAVADASGVTVIQLG